MATLKRITDYNLLMMWQNCLNEETR